jgi:signal transduction histidine kinase
MMRRFQRRPGRNLRHRIFFALSATIVFSVVVAGVLVHSTSTARFDPNAFRDFASDRFASVWYSPAQRRELVESVERYFRIQITLLDPQGRALTSESARCPRAVHRLTVTRHGQVLGTVEACVPTTSWPKNVVLGLLSLIVVLWAMSGLIARGLVRPLDELVQVVRDIGDGKLDARMKLRCHRHHDRGEVGEVAAAVNRMAEQIERQIAGQRELMAAVSHEIRSPLARLRVLVELERETQGDGERLVAMDGELSELDSLVGQLLAQSRLEFQTLERQSLLAVEVARTALDRASLPCELLVNEAEAAKVNVDASLIVRALLNLLDNGKTHGHTLEALFVRTEGNSVRFEIVDKGPGLDDSLLNRAFEPFVGERQGNGLGLGLSLVERIVRAHGGRVSLTNRPSGGAVATLELPRGDASSLRS